MGVRSPKDRVPRPDPEKELAGPYRRRRDFKLQPDANSSYIREASEPGLSTQQPQTAGTASAEATQRIFIGLGNKWAKRRMSPRF